MGYLSRRVSSTASVSLKAAVFLVSGVLTFSVSAFCQDAPVLTGPIVQQPIIRNITIEITQIFEDQAEGWLYRTANDIKISTKKEVVKRELLFKEGDRFDEFQMKETERNLRVQKYLRKVKITPQFVGSDTVDILVQAQDTWTLIPFLSYSSGTGKNSKGLGLSESNFLGTSQRLEGRYTEDESRKSYAAVYQDKQFMDTNKDFTIGYFDRNDGQIFFTEYGLPFRSLLQKQSWSYEAYYGDTIGRLFNEGEEKYIFRQQNERYGAYYTAAGPGRTFYRAKNKVEEEEYSGIYQGVNILKNRFMVGYEYASDIFEQADESDYDDLSLDPATVSNSIVPLNRRFSGPVIRFQNIQPNYISRSYIDRFDREEDYNLGDESLMSFQIAPEVLGSLKDSAIITGNRSRGWQLSDKDFLRAEAGFSGRIESGQLQNVLARTEAKYYNVLGDLHYGDWYLGRHTFAAAFQLDFGEDFDDDRQLTLGADNFLRGYEANTFEGDKRLTLNIEERVHFADDVLKLFSVGAAAFLDSGGATRDSLSSIVTDDFYSDVGLGLRVGSPRSSGGGVVRIDIAFPLRDGPDGSGQFEPRIIFAAGQLFGSRLRSEVVGAEQANVGVGFDR